MYQVVPYCVILFQNRKCRKVFKNAKCKFFEIKKHQETKIETNNTKSNKIIRHLDKKGGKP